MEEVMRIDHLTKYFYQPEAFKVLDDISFTVNKGEFLAITGKSGCGKSTLLYVLSTMDTKYEGRLNLCGQELTGKKLNELALFRNAHLSFVFQFHYLLPEFTVLQNVMIPALKRNQYSSEEIEQKAYDKLGILDMKEHALKRSSRLSGGQQQRVAIARALINDPDVIMGDEPTGNLDKTNSRKVFDIFRELSSEYKQTIIAVSHDLDFAKGSDRIIEMSDGRINGQN